MSYTETMMEYVYDQYCLIYNMEETLDFIEDEIDFTREEIKDMIQHSIDYNKEQFIKDYKSIVEQFKSKFYFTEIDCNKEKIKWPKRSGVYVIWKNDYNSLDNLIYVGMTGKYKRVNEDEVVFNSGSFDKRKGRWTPYRFCESVKDGKNQFSFRFGPKESTVAKQSKIKHQDNAYNKTIPYSEIKVHCFHVSDNHREYYTPELLEKEILTKYLKSSGNLPPANNEL
jgi:hypothetical protein